MPVNGYTVGRDVTVTMTGPGGTTVVIPATAITNFDAKPHMRKEWSRPLNVPPQPIYIPDGWTGVIEVDRTDATLDTFQATLEDAFWNGKNTLSGMILQTVTEDDGSVTQYQYESVLYWVDNPGNYRAEGRVTQHIEFCSSRRTRIA